MPRKPQTAAAYHQLGQTLRDLETDLRWGLEGSARIPAAWHEIAREAFAPPKAKITLRLDDDVLRFFRSMGRGHYTRINAVLRAFMLARLAEVVKASPEYAPSLADEERQLKAELRALLAAEEGAKAAALAAMSEKERRRAKVAGLRALRDRHLRGE